MNLKVPAHIAFALLVCCSAAAQGAAARAGAQEDEDDGAVQEDEPGAETPESAEAASDRPDTPDPAEEPAESPDTSEKIHRADEASVERQAGAHETALVAPVIHDRAKRVGSRDAAVKVSVKVIFASREGRGIDHRIKDLARGFQKEFKEDALTKFVLLDSKEFKLGPGLTLPVDVPGGRRLKIENGGLKGKQVVLGLEIEDLIRTTVLLTQNGKFSFGGPKYRYGEGMVIIVVKARPAGK
ncbi:MAG: hypothetical protein HY897_11550 [Deltaproteobacteria bacterium]|nr:hypothetical protein [Deltaproteobacteria bacterium]